MEKSTADNFFVYSDSLVISCLVGFNFIFALKCPLTCHQNFEFSSGMEMTANKQTPDDAMYQVQLPEKFEQTWKKSNLICLSSKSRDCLKQ